jgi:cysteine-rich repeat protein
MSGGGPNWAWQPAGSQTAVWVYFGIEDESYCANFGGQIKHNEADVFEATRALSPGTCPQAVCSNGQVELGEDCDDGNLVETDGCTTGCTTGLCVGESFDSTYEAIQQLVFADNGCTTLICHGAAAQGGLDLSYAVAYANLLEVPSTGSLYDRIEPASPNSSSLYLKLLLAVDPEATDIPGAPMPSGLPPIDSDLLEAVRSWILSGAPETGTVAGTERLLGGCFPDPVPISIAPLEPPDPGEGFQIEMPATPLAAQSEIEVCFATYYDVTDEVPAQFKDPTNQFFYSNSDLTRQDPHSHHLVIMHANVPESQVNHAGFGAWTCVGGAQDGSSCDPLDTGSCGAGFCRSQIGNNVACIGYGPPGGPIAANPANGLGGAGNGQTQTSLPAGLYRKVPLKGFVYWNVHAFNLTALPHGLKAYLNLLYTDDAQQEVESFIDFHDIYIAAGQAPYTKGTYCSTHTFAQGTRVFVLSSHNHQRGEVFWANDPQGTEIYRSFIYNDPVVEEYDPPLAFDSPNAAERTVTFCATYNNGVAPDASPEPATVRKRSVTPQNAPLCYPTACTAGMVGAPCNGPSDHATCDSTPGAADGYCDACAITAGVSTEDEMFVLTGRTYQ